MSRTGDWPPTSPHTQETTSPSVIDFSTAAQSRMVQSHTSPSRMTPSQLPPSRPSASLDHPSHSFNSLNPIAYLRGRRRRSARSGRSPAQSRSSADPSRPGLRQQPQAVSPQSAYPSTVSQLTNRSTYSNSYGTRPYSGQTSGQTGGQTNFVSPIQSAAQRSPGMTPGTGGYLGQRQQAGTPRRATSSTDVAARRRANRRAARRDTRRDPGLPFVPPPPKRRSGAIRRISKLPSPLLYGLRLLVLGVGIAGIAGTTLSIWNPELQVEANPERSIQKSTTAAAIATTGGEPTPTAIALPLGNELASLNDQLVQLETQMPGLELSSFVYDLESQAYLNFEGGAPVSAASMIKIPILVAFLQDVDQGNISLTEPLTINAAQVATGSGSMQDDPPGTVYSALETASWMIINSDNTATNMLIDRLGGAAKLNQRFKSWGLEDTVINAPLPDLEGTNTTSPEDLVSLLSMVNQGELLSLRSRDRLFSIMQRTYAADLLPQGLGDQSALIAHKTGDIGAMLGDAGIVDLPNGKRYAIAVMVQRPFNDGRAVEMIRLVSQATFNQFNQQPTPAAPAPPTPTN